MVLLVLAILLVGMGIPAHARTWYASVSGSGDVCTATEPCSAATAVSQAGPGDIVQFQPGEYRYQLNTQANGVTFQGASGYQTRILRPSNATGEQAVTISHDDIRMQGLVIDGEKKAGEKHGLIRFFSARGVTLRQNQVLNSKGTLLSMGGSVTNARISQVKLIGNVFSGAGFGDQWGEGLYIGSNSGPSGAVYDVEIVGNTIRDFADNGIDLKQGAKNIIIKNNLIEKQVLRTASSKYGSTIVTQGSGHHIHENIIRDVDAARAVFNLTTRANTKVYDNVISDAVGEWMVRQRDTAHGNATLVTQNLFCKTNTKKAESGAGIIIASNPGLDEAEQDCTPRIEALLKTIAEIQGSEVTPPPPVILPELTVESVTWGEVGDNVIRVYVEPVEAGVDLQMDKRKREGQVQFTRMDGTDLAIDRDRVAQPEHPPGWAFYLAAPYPDNQAIRMQAEKGWITGAPVMDAELPRWKPAKEPYQMAVGEAAMCPTSVVVHELSDGSGVKIECQPQKQ